MFKLNLKIAFRNLFKNKVYAAINIGGLAIGLTAFILLLLFINHESDYDKWDPELSKIYQIREKHDFFTPDNKQYWQEAVESRIGALTREKIPQFKHVTKVDRIWGNGFSVKIANADPIMVTDFRDADSAFFKVFPYQFVQGDQLTALNEPNTMVLKKKMAVRLFGTDKVVGKEVKVVMWRNDKGRSFKITGVVQEPSTPESVDINAIMHTGDRDKDPESISNSNYCSVYGLAGNILDTTAMNKTLQRIYVDYKKSSFTQRKITYDDYYKNGKVPGLKLVPLQETHANPPFVNGWLQKIKPVIALSIFLLLVSVINFVNLATAQSVQRAKEVGVKKVLGSYRKQLVNQFLFESAIQSLLALFISIVLVELCLPSFNAHFDVTLSFWHSNQLIGIALQLIGVFVVVTLLAGLYPAVVLSNYNPVSVLKGNYERGFKGLALRNGLVVVQFIIAVTFMISIGVMHLQTSYVANKDLGFDRSKLINIQTNYEDDFANRIKKIPGVQYVATTTQVMGNTFNVPEEITYNNQVYNVNTVTVSMDALSALGVQVVSGRIFSSEYGQDTVNTVVLNQAAANLMGKNLVGKQYDIISEKEKYTFQIVGIIKDYHNEGFDKTVIPTVYKANDLGGTSNTNNLLIRFNTSNYQDIVKKIEAEWKRLYPDFPMQYVTVEDAFQKELESSRRLMQMVVLFSIISVILSLLGLFALATFLAKRKTKEIAIRKILGASDFQIINMLNRSFLILVLFANITSWPIAYILTRKWLEGFAYRIDMPFLPFLAATVLSVVVAVFTITLQARKAAISNPVDSLKYE
ncbi:ABC transporter permease [Pedobacter metabolipauper]|uniref:Putative ABC transport system permease protein n=1 Tax=Pedobacter metabolipauper TaxID=425513 RepID=A0A4R6SV86_9SPHI|nr:ABC transporter permease [Pedobacter metabolipauper]TDQ08359.1 putative ABC transport system permease protein [Pedobacter metabolipauper]